LRQNRRQLGRKVVTPKGGFTHQHLKEQHAKGPDVGSLIQGLAAARLGAEKVWGAHQDTGLGQARAVRDAGDAKVGQAGGAVLGQQHVGRLQVAMDDAQVMGAGQGVGQFEGDLEGAGHGQT
jgi:hypothetical protein